MPLSILEKRFMDKQHKSTAFYGKSKITMPAT